MGGFCSFWRDFALFLGGGCSFWGVLSQGRARSDPGIFGRAGGADPAPPGSPGEWQGIIPGNYSWEFCSGIPFWEFLFGNPSLPALRLWGSLPLPSPAVSLLLPRSDSKGGIPKSSQRDPPGRDHPEIIPDPSRDFPAPSWSHSHPDPLLSPIPFPSRDFPAGSRSHSRSHPGIFQPYPVPIPIPGSSWSRSHSAPVPIPGFSSPIPFPSSSRSRSHPGVFPLPRAPGAGEDRAGPGRLLENHGNLSQALERSQKTSGRNSREKGKARSSGLFHGGIKWGKSSEIKWEKVEKMGGKQRNKWGNKGKRNGENEAK